MNEETKHPKVLHLVYNLMRGGTEGQCARVAMAMAQRGHDHRVAVFRRDGYFLPQVENQCGGVFEIRIRKLVSFYTLQQLFKLAQFVRRHEFDIIHAWDADAVIFGSLVARFTRCVFVASQRDLGEIYPRWKRGLMLSACRSATATVVNARAVTRFLDENGVPADKIKRIPNILDVEDFDRQSCLPLSPELVLPSGRLIGTVSRLDPEKDVEVLLSAMVGLTQKYSDLYLVVVGDGCERSTLEDIARRTHIDGHVLFLGERFDVPALLKCFDLGVLVSRSNEGLSNSILEYMAAGLPVVSTDCGGSAELVDDSVTGYVVPRHSSEKLVEAIGKLLNQPDLASDMGRGGRKKLMSEFSDAHVLDRFDQLYARLTTH